MVLSSTDCWPGGSDSMRSSLRKTLRLGFRAGLGPPGCSSSSVLTSSAVAKRRILAFLNGSDTGGGEGGLTIDHPATDHLDFDSANNPALSQADICADVATLIRQTDSFPNNKVRYDLLGKLAPNSNSFIRYLTTFIPNIGITSPGGAVGWNHKIFGR